MHRPQLSPNAPTGLAFEIADLMLLQGWADFHDVQMTASMQGDLARGNRLELPWLSGAVVELGRRAGIPTPLNRAVADILALYVNGAP